MADSVCPYARNITDDFFKKAYGLYFINHSIKRNCKYIKLGGIINVI